MVTPLYETQRYMCPHRPKHPNIVTSRTQIGARKSNLRFSEDSGCYTWGLLHDMLSLTYKIKTLTSKTNVVV